MNDVVTQNEVEGKYFARDAEENPPRRHGGTEKTLSNSKTFETRRNGGSGGYWRKAKPTAD
jgi:hypothetical protein